MTVLRTPDDRFADLPEYPFQPQYYEVGESLRLHYLDEGSPDAPVVLMMHGQPSWSYLYRRMIPPVVAAGCRVLAPDLIGFGRSDKPAEQDAYTYENHVAWMLEWLDTRALSNVLLFCQDWGGLIGLRLVAARPDLFAGVIAGNTGLPEGHGMSDAVASWIQFSQAVPELPIGGILQGASGRALTDAEVAAYDAPFPDETFKAGARRFPLLIPLTPDHASVAENKAAWRVLEGWTKPFVTCFSDADPITAGGERVFQARVPGCAGQPHRTIAGGGHFLQEDAPDELAAMIVELRGRV
jgi:haloalkane dehalogenase